MNRKIRIVIADDTDIAREGLVRILASEEDLEIVEEGTTPNETIRIVNELQPDILILDLKWFENESAGIDAIKRLRKEVPETKVIAITVYPHLIEPAMNAGAFAALTKDISKRQLVEEIRGVNMLSRHPSQSSELSAEMIEELTPRELEVLALVASGKTDKEIAEELNIAESTAKNHVSHILGKLNTPNRAGAAALGYKLGIIDL